MSDPFIAEIRIFAGNFAPRTWAFCNGQLLPIAQNSALFSLIGTTYGGDGRTTTALPNLQGRAPMHPGNGPGLTSRRLGERGGQALVTLSENQIPSHNHALSGTDAFANTPSPASARFSDSSPNKNYSAPDDGEQLDSSAMANTGAGQAHNNMQPFQGLNFIICLAGLYPSRS